MIPDEYASLLGVTPPCNRPSRLRAARVGGDYQRDISRLCVRKRKFAVFAACGSGKTVIFLSYCAIRRLAWGSRSDRLAAQHYQTDNGGGEGVSLATPSS